MMHRSILPMACWVVAARVANPDSSQNPWPRHVIDDSTRGADGIRLADLNGDGHPDVITTEESAGENHTGLGVIWYENLSHW